MEGTYTIQKKKKKQLWKELNQSERYSEFVSQQKITESHYSMYNLSVKVLEGRTGNP